MRIQKVDIFYSRIELSRAYHIQIIVAYFKNLSPI